METQNKKKYSHDERQDRDQIEVIGKEEKKATTQEKKSVNKPHQRKGERSVMRLLGVELELLATSSHDSEIAKRFVHLLCLPAGKNYIFSETLLRKILQCIKNLQEYWRQMQGQSDPKVFAEKLVELQEITQKYSMDVLQQFVADNCSTQTWNRFKSKRWEDAQKAYTSSYLCGLLNITQYLLKGDMSAALDQAKAFVRSNIFGVTNEDRLTERESVLIHGLASTFLELCESSIIPAIYRTIDSINVQHPAMVFAKNTWHALTYSPIYTLFSEEEFQRHKDAFTPLMHNGVTNTLSDVFALAMSLKGIKKNITLSPQDEEKLILVLISALSANALVAGFSGGAGITGAAMRSAKATDNVISYVGSILEFPQTAAQNIHKQSINSTMSFDDLVKKYR